MNPNGILTTYEERMKANLQRYQHPEKPASSIVRKKGSCKIRS